MRWPEPIPIRCANLIEGSDSVVRRVLHRSDVWVRAAAAVGGQLEIAGAAPVLRHGALVRFRPGPMRRAVLLRVVDSAGLPGFESANGAGSGRVRVRVMVAQTAAGTVATIEFVVTTAVPLVNFALRPELVRYGEMVLGIAALAGREPVRVVAGALVDKGRVLLARRKSSAAGGGRWELPGGKVEPGETDEQALQRELLEELSLSAKVCDRVGPMIEVEPGVELVCYLAELTTGDPVTLVDHDAFEWVGPADLHTVDLLESDRQLVESLRTVLQNLS